MGIWPHTGKQCPHVYARTWCSVCTYGVWKPKEKQRD